MSVKKLQNIAKMQGIKELVGDMGVQVLLEIADNYRDILEALEGLVSVRDAQAKRESEEFHLSPQAFMALWDNENSKAKAALAKAKDKS